MTREEAMAILEVSKHMATSGRMYNQAIDMAIEALSADAEDRLYIKIYADDEPSVKAEKLYQICGETQNREVTEWLKEYFPSADAVHGEWKIDEYGIYHCPFCHAINNTVYKSFCPNCGTKMDKGGDTE